MIRTLALAALSLIVTGCASSGFRITYATEPAGAAIICSGTNQGYSPVTLTYQPDERTKEYGRMTTQPCVANWSSGVKQSFPRSWDLNKWPNGVISTLPRPSGAGYSQDVEFALKVQQMKNQNAQAAAAANAAAWQSVNQGLNDLSKSIRENTPKITNTNCNDTYGGVNCTSTTY